MTTILFLAGCGVGALLATLLFLCVLLRQTKGDRNRHLTIIQEHHEELLIEFRERNRLLAEQNRRITARASVEAQSAMVAKQGAQP